MTTTRGSGENSREQRARPAASAEREVDPAILEMSYTDAIADLDRIIDEFENGVVDVDRLVDRLERATCIVDELDRRLRRTRMRVEELVPRLEESERPAPAIPVPGDLTGGSEDALNDGGPLNDPPTGDAPGLF
ncbi:MAG: hypothetical protein ACYCVN_12880 [Acidimicrobiales bacterium]